MFVGVGLSGPVYAFMFTSEFVQFELQLVVATSRDSGVVLCD